MPKNTHLGRQDMKAVESIEQLEAIMEQEKHDLVEEIFHDAWAEAIKEGIEPEVIVRGATCSAFKQAVDSLGKKEAQRVAQDVSLMIDSGQFVKEFRFN